MQVLVLHDAGEECDDQIAIWKLITELNGAFITLVICGRTNDIQQDRLSKWLKLLPSLDNGKNVVINILLSDFKLVCDVKYDAVLQIAPLFGFDSLNVKTDRYVLMGSVDNSVNCPKGSVDLFRRFEGLPGTIVVESADAAKVRPTKEFIQTIPKVLFNEMLIVGFRLMLCRCNPTEVYAEGLINCKVGRGANFDTVMNMFNATFVSEGEENVDNVEHTVVPLENNPEIEYYINSLVVKKEPEITMRMMEIMYRALDKVFGFMVPVITASGWTKFLESEQGVKSFSKFEKVALEHPEILNPLYDYYAATILLDSF
jgi:hypothetical protein